MKFEHRALHVGKNSPVYQHRLGADLLEQGKKDPKAVSQQCVLVT